MFIKFGKYFNLHWQSTVREVLRNIVHTGLAHRRLFTIFTLEVALLGYNIWFGNPEFCVLYNIVDKNRKWLFFVGSRSRHMSQTIHDGRDLGRRVESAPHSLRLELRCGELHCIDSSVNHVVWPETCKGLHNSSLFIFVRAFKFHSLSNLH